MMTRGDNEQPALRVLFVGHEATRTGAPIGFLSLMRWLKQTGEVKPVIWLRHGGVLEAEHAGLAPTAIGTEAEALADAGGIHLAYLNTATLGSHAEALKQAGVPVICHAHEMDFELAATGPANLERLRRCVRLFIACSEAVKQSLIRCAGVAPEKVVVIPECVDVDRALRQAKEPPLIEARMAGKMLVCGMGTVSWRKGVDLFLRVVAELGEGWSGLWIGDLENGPDADRVRHDLRVSGLEDRVVFSGSAANPHALLNQADVFCLTSREDPYPLAMIEAAALGKPVIGFSGSGGVEEFALQGGAMTVAYADTHGMAQLAARLAINGETPESAAVARRFCHPDVVGQSVLDCVRRVVKSPPVELTTALRGRLAEACAQPLRAEVTLTLLESKARIMEWWEGSANGEAQVELLNKTETGSGGSFEIVLAPATRSVVISRLKVAFQSPETLHVECPVQVRSSGRVARLTKEEGGAWLLLDGHGRLVIRGENCPAGACIVLSWKITTDVKQALSSLPGFKPANNEIEPSSSQPSIWKRLGLP